MGLTVDQVLREAIEHHKKNNLQEAEKLYRAILQLHSKHPDANHNLGVIAVSIGKLQAALPLFKLALEANSQVEQFWISYIDALIKINNINEAHEAIDQAKKIGVSIETVSSFERMIEETIPKSISQKDSPALQAAKPSSLKQKLLAKKERKKSAKQVGYASKEKLVSAPPQDEINLLLNYYISRNYVAAETLAKSLTVRFPSHSLGWKSLGTILYQVGRQQEAILPLKEAIRLNGADYESHYNLGVVLYDLGHLDEAEASYREAIKLKPDYAQAHSNLGSVFYDLRRLDEAEASYREAIKLKPDYAEAHYNLGVALGDMGHPNDAELCYRQAIELKPDYAEARSNLLMILLTLNYTEVLSVEDSLNEARLYGIAVSKKQSMKFSRWNCQFKPKKLRIGLVSGDFNNHPVGFFIEGLLKNIDRNQFEVMGYMSDSISDDLTKRIKSYFDDWILINGKSDWDTAQLIYDHAPHILIDLSGHTAKNRLPVFSFKPAPIQASYLGYFATTGLPEIDYIIGDPYVTPENEESHFSEKVLRLPQTYICFFPPKEQIDIFDCPAHKNNYVTFGCFNNLSKMGGKVVEVWSKILNTIPNSKLLLKTKQLSDKNVSNNILKQFLDQNIPSSRIILEGASPRVDLLYSYNQVDIALDPFPYPGGQTSLEALWMGVPVLTLKGDRFLSHIGETIAHNSGQLEWIAADRDDYVNKAVRFATNIEHLSATKKDLRRKVLASPLFDAENFTRHFEEAMWSMWKNYERDLDGG